MTIIMKGADVAFYLKENIKKEVLKLKEKGKDITCGFIRVGNSLASKSYENLAIEVLSSVGINCIQFNFKEDITENNLIDELKKIDKIDNIDGFLLLRPLPKHIDDHLVGIAIDPSKDIDAVNPYNMGEIFYSKKSSFIPCTAVAVMKMIEFYNLNLTGKRAVILGRSNVIGKPVAMLLLEKDATVTICHSKTKDLKEICKKADILISAIGKSRFITKEFIKKGAIVIDVGMNYDKNGEVTGDVDYENVKEIASFITPVPGGIGTVTTAILAENCLTATRKKVKKFGL